MQMSSPLFSSLPFTLFAAGCRLRLRSTEGGGPVGRGRQPLARLVLGLLVVLGLVLPGSAQSSAGFTIESGRLVQGGSPDAGGSTPTSASHSLRLDAIGQIVHGPLSSSSLRLEGGGVGGYGLPGEVLPLRFVGGALDWDPVPNALRYAVYRAQASQLPAVACVDGTVAGTSWTPVAVPTAGDPFVYLVVALDRLDAPGTPGEDSAGTRRSVPPCS